MNHTMLKGKVAIIFSIVLLLTSSLITQKASAEEVVISGNGSESNSEVSVSLSSDTNISSNNTTDIANNVNVDANTGNNSASSNTGGNTQVHTGDAAVSTTIQNEANTNIVNANQCCPTGTSSITISNNGSGSVNTVNHTLSNTTNINFNNYANIVNNVMGNANTGGNTANFNTGNVTIRTGDIAVNSSLKNGPINTSWITLGIGSKANSNITIKGNGTDSLNVINYLDNNQNNVDVTNVADIFNNVLLNLNTGYNEADENVGDVSVKTGDIQVDTVIENAVNVSKVTIDCNCKEKGKPQENPPAPSPEKVTPSNPSSEKTSSGSSGEVASIATGKVLPVTGINLLLLAFIGNVMMLFLGMILRLRSGNSPGLAA